MAPSVCAAGSVCGRGPGTGLRRNQRGTQGGRRRARARAAGDGHGEGRVRVKFNLKPKHLFSDDEVVRLVGANNELGNWDVGRGKHLKIDDARTDGGDLLTAEVELPKGSFVEFKVSALVPLLPCESGQLTHNYGNKVCRIRSSRRHVGRG